MQALNVFELVLVESAFKGAILLAIVSAVVWAVRRGPAALRHDVWSMAFIALMLIPPAVALLPELRFRYPEPGPAVEATEKIQVTDPAQALVKMPQLLEQATKEVLRRAEPVLTAPVTPVPDRTGKLVIVWAVGVVLLLGRLGATLVQLRYTTRTAHPVTDPEWNELAEITCARLCITRPIRLLQSQAVAVPMTYGVRRPVVMLPLEAMNWPEDQKEVILLHEMMHVRRNDFLVHLVAHVALAVHWFNPLAWYGAFRLRAERERACDDEVLAAGVPSTNYADHLLDMAKSILTGREASRVALAMARPSELRSRIAAILDPSQQRGRISRVQPSIVAVLMLLAVLPLAAAQPFTGNSGPGAVPAPPTPAVIAVPAPEEIPAPAVEALDVEMPEVPADIFAAVASAVALEDTTEDEALKAQRHAIFALSQLPREQAIPRLTEIARTHSNPVLRGEAIFWLGQRGGADVADMLTEFARNDASPEVQKKALFALSQLGGGAGVTALINLARNHPNTKMRNDAIFWLGQSNDPRAADVLMEIANQK